jgi:hypothetical protein
LNLPGTRNKNSSLSGGALSTENKPLRNPDYRLEKMDNEILLFNPQSQVVLYLNESASLIWQLCDGQRSVPEFAKLLTDTYPEAAAEILTDVHETIQQFLDKKVITLV